ncbi:unnamed protein product [Blepharisma stoltei]|uniref:lipoate--protein ligase n=1 Tax=Blepharisma stoltei TaxID=1481888 RepID=A0AAU9IXQ5_9CILI|nr:unnamed protein product [Blepharisma stoltei]
MKPRFLITKTTSIFQNLAFEEHLLENVKSPILCMYQNDKTIVIGRNQNPWKEIHIDRMNEDNVQLCRRKSGGGAVYQDLGNTCFSFITPDKSNVDFKVKNNSIILRALSALGIDAVVSGRNDILLDSKKISGSAYKIHTIGSQTISLHHGTMMINVEKDAILRYLNPNKAKLLSKGINSVSSRVMNLAEVDPTINHERFITAIRKSFLKEYPNAENTEVTEMPEDVEAKAQAYLNWDWRYGVSPVFTHQLENYFSWGLIDLQFNVVKGVVEGCKIFSDCLYPDYIDKLETMFIGKRYGIEMLEDLQKDTSNFQKMSEELAAWLKEKL